MLTDFQNSVTVRLNSDYVTKQSVKITVADCSLWAYKQDSLIRQSSETTWFYMLQYHSIILIDSAGHFFMQAVSTLTFCASFAVCTPKKCNNLRNRGHTWPSRCVAAEQRRPQSNWLQNLGNNLATSLQHKSAGYEWFDAASDWCVSRSGTQHCSGAGVSKWHSSHTRTF